MFLCVLLCLPTWVLGEFTKLDIQTPLRAVYVLPDSDAELITVSMVILAGEVDLTGPEGLSHYLEHLMFWHADTLGAQSMHARGGNAWVNGIITTYYNTGEASELEDMFEFAQRILTPPTLETTFMLDERKVVTREYDLRLSENPDWRVATDMRRQLYSDHPLSRSVIGTPQSIMSLTLDQARSFHQEFYHAANAVLIVTGNVTAKRVNKLVEARFSQFPESAEHSQAWRRATIDEPMDKVQEYREEQAKSDRLLYASLSSWSGDGDKVQENYTREFVLRLFNSALSGSLAKPLRLDNFIVSDYQLVIEQFLENHVELLFFARPDDGIGLEVVDEHLRSALSQQGLQGIPTKSFDRIKKRWLQTANRERGSDQNGLWRAWHFLSQGLEPIGDAEHLQRIDAVTQQDVNSLLAALGTPERKITGLIKGK